MDLYLIRHGQSHVNLKEWQDGNVDEGLTDKGRGQVAALARWLPGEVPEIDALYSSTMRRALETAAVLAGVYGCTLRPDDRLREIGNNRSDHTPWPNDALPREYAEHWPSKSPFSPVVLRAEGAETWVHFRTRVGLFVEEIIERYAGGQDPDEGGREAIVLAVCHGGVIDAAFDHIFNVGPWRRCEVWNHNTGITRFQYVAHPGREVWRLRYQNRMDHLREE
jgi:2,3-bisphosphoglycerate-dependent phosphoglycerate mutase